jgi:hypothetical protein
MPSNGLKFSLSLSLSLSLSRQLGVRRFDVDGGNVIGEQHDLVRMQLRGVLPEQVLRLDQAGLEQPHGEGAGADEGIDDVDALVAQ